jgi:hypothetical protein
MCNCTPKGGREAVREEGRGQGYLCLPVPKYLNSREIGVSRTYPVLLTGTCINEIPAYNMEVPALLKATP